MEGIARTNRVAELAMPAPAKICETSRIPSWFGPNLSQRSEQCSLRDATESQNKAHVVTRRTPVSVNSKIEWTDTTWNPVRGCTKISAGCKHCYAETFAERFRGVPGNPFEFGFDLRLVPHKLSEPLKWTRPQMVFVKSKSDLFHEDVPDEYIVHVACGKTEQVDWRAS